MLKKILLLILIAIPAMHFMLAPGFYEPQDLHHIADIYQMVRAFGSHQVVPRLGPDYIFGYGYPLFNFYYPLPFYIGALFFSLAGTLTESLKLVFVFGILTSVVGMYLFLREFFDEWASMAGTVLFLYTPYRAVQIYVRGAIGEALALCLLPLFLWAIIKVIKKSDMLSVFVMGIVGAFFILSHNYFWFLSVPYIGTFIIAAYLRRINLKILVRLLIGVLISFGISFYWWFPALFEQKLVSATTPFPLIDHFPFIKQLIEPFWGYGASLWGPSDGMSFQIGLVNWAILILLTLLLIFNFRKFSKKKILGVSLWVILGMIITVFMMNVRSFPIWRLIPFYNFVQFPWRLLIFTTFLTSFGGAIVVSYFSNRKKILVFGAISVLSVGLTLNYFRPSHVVYTTDDFYLKRMFADRSVSGQTFGTSKEYLQYSEDYLQLTPYMEKKPTTLPQDKIVSKTASVSDIVQNSDISWSAKVGASQKSEVTFYAMYFPGWRAILDGKETKTFPGSNGEVQINVEKGDHEVTFEWYETNLRLFADVFSLGTLGVCLIALYNDKKTA